MRGRRRVQTGSAALHVHIFWIYIKTKIWIFQASPYVTPLQRHGLLLLLLLPKRPI